MAENDSALQKGIDFIHEFVSYMKTEDTGEKMDSTELSFVCGEVSMKVGKKSYWNDKIEMR